MQKGFSTVIVIAGILVVVVIGVTAFFLMNSSKQKSVDTDSQTQNPNIQSSIAPIANPSVSKVANSISTNLQSKLGFKKRLYDPTKDFIINTKYPTELTGPEEDTLTGISCSEQYNRNPDGSYAYYPENSATNSAVPADKNQNILIDKTSSQVKKELSDFKVCSLEDGRAIGIFSEQLGGGGAGKNTYVGLIQDNKTNLLAFIPNKPTVYFGCNAPLQVSGNNFYLQCNAGDGLGGYSAIYKIDLVANSLNTVIACSSMGNLETNQPTVKCE